MSILVLFPTPFLLDLGRSLCVHSRSLGALYSVCGHMPAFILKNLVDKLYLLVLLYVNVHYGFRVIYIEWACWKKVIFTFCHIVLNKRCLLVDKTWSNSSVYEWSLVTGCNLSYYACNYVSLFPLECLLGIFLGRKVLNKEINKHIIKFCTLAV
jgi:hypothetical protein